MASRREKNGIKIKFLRFYKKRIGFVVVVVVGFG